VIYAELQTYFILKRISSKEGFTGFARDCIEIITQGSITTNTTNLGINFQPRIIRPWVLHVSIHGHQTGIDSSTYTKCTFFCLVASGQRTVYITYQYSPESRTYYVIGDKLNPLAGIISITRKKQLQQQVHVDYGDKSNIKGKYNMTLYGKY
jgi:hypothetical protein